MNGQVPLKIATRSSRLAAAQARAVAVALPAPAELVRISTRGDRAGGPLGRIGGKGLFTAELESALRRGQVQLAVHSAKDLPTDIDDDLVIAAVPRREDPRDALISPAGVGPADLPAGARVGTASLRRAAQVRAIRPDLRVVPVRGNVDTRIRKLREGHCEALVLAMAGLNRLGLAEKIGQMIRPLDIRRFVPAAGQGALAVQCLAADEATLSVVAAVNDADSAAAIDAERRVVRRLGATCRSALGVHVWPQRAGWRGAAMVADPGGQEVLHVTAEAATAEAAGQDLFDRLAGAGAKKLLGG